MAEQASRMSRLVDDLLSLSRIELNEHVQPEARVDIRRVLMAVADGLEQRAEKRRMRIELALPESLPEVVGVPDELAQVFQNLMDNAIKYGRPDTAVEVGAAASSRRLGGASAVQVTIRDHGDGIQPEHLPRLTERFYRVDVGDSRAQGGTGLGLSLVKHIVNRHRGRLLIESVPKNGATFTACFPQLRSSAAV
jgi:two-component system phosphate regulon sensor histidine kinase PhoR